MKKNLFDKDVVKRMNHQQYAIEFIAQLTTKKEWIEYCAGYSLKVGRSISIMFYGMKCRDCKDISTAYAEIERLPLRNLSIKSYEYYIQLHQ